MKQMAKEQEQQGIQMSAETLQQLITSAVTAAVAAAKAPTEIEQRKLDAEKKEIDEQQKHRLQTADQQRAAVKQRRWVHENCTHEHKNGDTHCVYVAEKQGAGFLICQAQQCIIRPGDAPAGYQGTDVYNTALFNKIFQKLPTGELFS
jgi:hypothetical protein